MEGKILFAYFRGFRNAFSPLSKTIKDIKIYFAEDEKELFEKLSSDKIDILAFSTLINFPTKELLDKIRERFPNIFILGGGPQATGDPENTLSLGFSALLLGECEETFPNFIKEFYGKRNFESIPGLYPYNKHLPPKVDIDKFFFYFENLPYFPPLEISRGCPFGCKFCAVSYIFGTKMRHRSIKNIIEHLNFLVNKGEKIIHFISPNAFAYGGNGKNIEKEALEELLFNLWKFKKEKGVKIYFGSFPSEVRPDFVNKETLKFLKKYTDTKCIVIGAQSGSNRVLEKANRGHTVDDVLKAVEISRKYGFQVKVDFIFGIPGEEAKDREETWRLIEKIIDMKGKINAHIFIPLSGSPWANEKTAILSEEDLERIKRLSNEEILIGNWEKHLKIIERKFIKLI
jgi:B12-binding domain/radical SAM domain protein